MSEYRFDHPAEMHHGRTVFELRNAGTVTHELVLVALPEDFPPIQEQLRAPERRGVDTVVAIHDRAPGTRDVFAAELRPGRYGFICFVRDTDGVPHSLKGMTSEFRVT